MLALSNPTSHTVAQQSVQGRLLRAPTRDSSTRIYEPWVRIAPQLIARSRQYEPSHRTANDTINLTQTADSALKGLQARLLRMREMLQQAEGEDWSGEQQTELEEAFTQFTKERQRASRHTAYEGTKLLDGSFRGKRIPLRKQPIAFGALPHLEHLTESLTEDALSTTTLDEVITAVNGVRDQLKMTQSDLSDAAELQSTLDKRTVTRMVLHTYAQIRQDKGKALKAQANALKRPTCILLC